MSFRNTTPPSRLLDQRVISSRSRLNGLEPICHIESNAIVVISRFSQLHRSWYGTSTFASVLPQNTQLNLKALLLEGVIDTKESLLQRIEWHYTKQFLQSVYKVVGSLDLIGNPASFFSDLGGGVKDFYYEPRKGLVKSPSAFTYVSLPGATYPMPRTRKPECSELVYSFYFFPALLKGLASGTTSLLSGVFIGGAAGVLSAASASTTIVGHFASALTFDPLYRRRRQLLQQQHATRTSQVLIWI